MSIDKEDFEAKDCSVVPRDFVGLHTFLVQCINTVTVTGRYTERRLASYRGTVSTASRFNLKNSGVLIEGDSLLLHFLGMKFSDSSKLINCDYGASSLHICYLVGHYLETFVTHDVKVDVVFFQNHCKELYSNKHYLLLRQLVIRSIRGSDPLLGISVHQFSSFLSWEFDHFMTLRMQTLAPLELMLFKPELEINSWYGLIMLNYWGVAIGDIAHCNLVGTCEIRDVVREDRVSDIPALQISPDGASERSQRYDEEDCVEIEMILSGCAASGGLLDGFILENESETERDDASEAGDGDERSLEEQCDELHDDSSPVVEKCTAAGWCTQFGSDLSRVNCEGLTSLLSGLALKHPQFESFVQSHTEAVHILSTTHPTQRFKYYLAEPQAVLCSDKLSEFEAYCAMFFDAMLNAVEASANEIGTSEVARSEEGATLFVGDVWDGRLLVAVHLTLHPEDRTTELVEPRLHVEFAPPFAIEGTLVDNVKRVASEKFSDVAHLHPVDADYSDNNTALSGVGGGIPVETLTHNRLAIGVPSPRACDTRKLYRECECDFFDQPRHNGERPAVQFAVVESASTKSTCSHHLSTTTSSTMSSDASSIGSEEEEEEEDQSEEVTSGLYEEGQSITDLLQRQELMSDTIMSDLEHSGKVQLEAVAQGKLFTPLGPTRAGWQTYFVTNTSRFNVLPPRYNALPCSPALESELARRYMYEDGFRPEPWQLSMLQSIEQDRSILIMAPTSSGKTLAAKYAMRKVCRDNLTITDVSKKGRGIFVQPTNPLVSQTFSSFLSDPHVGSKKVAIFTAETQSPNFSDGSYEVLITNPQCLHILLTSGHSTDNTDCFYERLRAVVFDEVHCIGLDGGSDGTVGVVWEQLLATVDCPIIGLSATLANAEPFYKWLCTTKQQQTEHKLLTGQSVPWSGVVDRLEHFERSTPLHYFNKVGWADGSSTLPTVEELLDPLTPVVEGAPLQLESTHSLRILKSERIVAEEIDNDVQSLPIRKVTFSWHHESLLSSEVALKLDSDNGTHPLHRIAISSDLVQRGKKDSAYRLTISETSAAGVEQHAVSKEDFWHCNSKPCWVGMTAVFKGDILKLKVISFNTAGVQCSVSLNVSISGVVGRLKITTLSPIAVESIDIESTVSPPTHIVRLSRPESDVEINPLQFLPAFDHHNDDQLAGFFDAVPHIKLIDIQSLVSEMQRSLVLDRFIGARQLSQHELSGGGYGGVETAYNHLGDLIASQLAVSEAVDVDGLQRHAQFRLQFSKLVAQMHSAVLALPVLLDRVFMDALCAHSLQSCGIDWYGQQWLDGFSAIGPLQENELLFRNHLLLNCDSKLSVVMYSLNKATSCLFANDFEAAEEAPDLFCVYPSSITAVNRAIYYFLHLLLKRDDDTVVVSQSSWNAAGLDNRGAELTTTSSDMHNCLIRMLKPKSPLHSDFQDKFKSVDVASLLKGMLVDSCETIAAPNVIRNASGETVSVNQVQQPTLIFHLDKKKLDRFIEDLVGDDLLGAWFGSSAGKGCFLTPAEIAEISALPYTSEERKLGLMCGIGLHNAVVKESRQYRSMVEKLFQNKKLLFVFATTSLSYGINMPCSKVVFLGDSPHLTNMVFRQSSGRAGRRGHMSGAGNIYFVGFTQLSIIRKLCTPIDSLSPRQAVSPAYILKLTSVSSTCHENNNKWVDHMALQGLVNPLFERLLEGKDVIRTQFRTALLNSIHFSWSFLAERGYINSVGVAQVKASLPYRVHYLEPRCFLLAELFDSFLDPMSGADVGLLGLVDDKLLHTDSEDKQKRQDRLDLNVFMVLVYFASFSFIPPGHQEISTYRLPNCVRAAWHQYNAEVTRSLVGFMRFHSVNIAEEQFPLNPRAFGTTAASTGNFSSDVGEDVRMASARSCFTVSSGLGDEFRSIQEMLLSVKKGMIIDSRVIPTTDVQDQVNTTLLTTFQDGRLIKTDRDAETSCESFSRHLRGVVKALELMYNALTVKPLSDSKPHVLMQSFQRVRAKYLAQFKRAKKAQFCRLRQGIVTSVREGGCTVHYFDERQKLLRCVDVRSEYQVNRSTVWEVLDCVQFYQPKDDRKWMNVTYLEHLRSEDDVKISAIAYEGRVGGEFSDDFVNELVVASPLTSDDVQSPDVLLSPRQFRHLPALHVAPHCTVRVVYCPEVCTDRMGFAVTSKILGIAAKFQSEKVDSIYYLGSSQTGLRLFYATVVGAGGPTSLVEGDIVEFTKRDFIATDITVLRGVERAVSVTSTLRNVDHAKYRYLMVMPSNKLTGFYYSCSAVLHPATLYKFLHSSLLSTEPYLIGVATQHGSASHSKTKKK